MTKLKEPIAIVKLGHGEIGYFDKITRLRLTRKAPYGRIYDDMDLKNIRRSVKVGRLILVNGMLPAENANYSKMAKRFIPSSNYDMVASGLIHPEDIMEKTVTRSKETEFDLEAALAEAKESLDVDTKAPSVENVKVTGNVVGGNDVAGIINKIDKVISVPMIVELLDL